MRSSSALRRCQYSSIASFLARFIKKYNPRMTRATTAQTTRAEVSSGSIESLRAING